MLQIEFMKGCILIAISLCLFGCSKDDPNPIDSTVHLAGFVGAYAGIPGATYPVASYWKDGAYTDLTHDSIYSQVNSLYVDGGSVLIGGNRRVVNSPSAAVFWQDGKETVIEGAFGEPNLITSRNNNLFGVWHDLSIGAVFSKNGIAQPFIDTAQNIGPTGLALLGDDMYISGCSTYHDWTSADSKTYQHAQCWKNGQLIFRESELSNAMSIFIHQNDIYMAGYFDNVAAPNSNACYWKNGQRVNLTGVKAIALSVFVADTHVYVSGVMDNQAVYWKDGELIVLTTPGPYSAAYSIFVQGTDVHVAGVEHGHPAYWKNDVKQDIANQNKFGYVKFVVVGSN